MITIKNIFYLLKIHHWIKNLSIFLPLFVAQSLSFTNLNLYFYHFLIFSISSSIVYLFNNLKDYEKDLENKKLNYQIKSKYRIKLHILGILSALFFIIYLSIQNNNVLPVICGYLILSILYNVLLKNIKYLDIIIISIFHMLRIIYGSIAFNIEISYYFLIFCLSVFLMIGANKRLFEIENNFSNRPYKLKDRTKIRFLQLFFAGIILFTFLTYIIHAANTNLYQHTYLLFINLFLLILIIVNFLFFHKNKSQDVIIFIYKSKTNFVLILIFFIIFSYNSNLF